MNIIVQENSEKTKIIVQSLQARDDINHLLAALNKYTKIELSFFNIQTIPQIIVLKLYEKKDNIEILTNESTLKTYLLHLGFKLEYINHYQSKKPLNLDYIAIGGSAGSLAKFIEIIKNLPKSHISIFIIMHHLPDKKSELANILRFHTKHYNVVEAESDMKIEPSTIYTAPPGKHMIVAGDYIFLTDEKKRNYSRPSISTSFESLSNEFKNKLLALLVCGYGSDGSDSLEKLHENQTTVILEDSSECEAKAMIENAISTTFYDDIMSLEEINNFISSNLSKEHFNETNLKTFLDKIYTTYGYDYRNYETNHIQRRIEYFYNIIKPKSFEDFENRVLSNKNIFKDLFLNISINVTTFFRNPEIFKILREELLPKLDSYLDIKIWCAGCSSGEEPYSIAIFLKELGLLDRSLIYATDTNDLILEHAKNGLFSKESYNLFLKHYYQSGGSESFSEYFDDYNSFVKIKKELQEKILFFRHNLALDSKINDFQLIFCRNVIIYFDKDLKERVFNLFNQSLDNYGFLILGESESLDDNKNFQAIDKKNKIYKRSSL